MVGDVVLATVISVRLFGWVVLIVARNNRRSRFPGSPGAWPQRFGYPRIRTHVSRLTCWWAWPTSMRHPS
jgi:hypothetical protein